MSSFDERSFLPCPFCGGKAILDSFDSTGMAGSQMWKTAVRCSECKARGPFVRDGVFAPDGMPEKAIKLWNIRMPAHERS